MTTYNVDSPEDLAVAFVDLQLAETAESRFYVLHRATMGAEPTICRICLSLEHIGVCPSCGKKLCPEHYLPGDHTCVRDGEEI